jgi:hypothetical protein
MRAITDRSRLNVGARAALRGGVRRGRAGAGRAAGWTSGMVPEIVERRRARRGLPADRLTDLRGTAAPAGRNLVRFNPGALSDPSWVDGAPPPPWAPACRVRSVPGHRKGFRTAVGELPSPGALRPGPRPFRDRSRADRPCGRRRGRRARGRRFRSNSQGRRPSRVLSTHLGPVGERGRAHRAHLRAVPRIPTLPPREENRWGGDPGTAQDPELKDRWRGGPGQRGCSRIRVQTNRRPGRC